MHVPADDLLDSLRAEGLRITPARQAVCRALTEAHDQHLTAPDLRDRAEAVAGRPIDPSTIYRTIDALEKAGRLHHVHLGHGPSVVHLSEDEHHHLVCERCGRTVDLPLEELGPLGAVIGRHGFRPDSVHFALVGVCDTHPER